MVKLWMASYAKTDHMQLLVLINTYKDTATLLKVPPNMPPLWRVITSFSHHQFS